MIFLDNSAVDTTVNQQETFKADELDHRVEVGLIEMWSWQHNSAHRTAERLQTKKFLQSNDRKDLLADSSFIIYRRKIVQVSAISELVNLN